MKPKAFTLIELLIVIAIITVLAGAMVPMYRTTKLQSQIAKVKKDLEAIRTACYQYHYDTG